MSAKKGKGGKLPRVDRSRALPVRSGIGFWKTLVFGAVVGFVVWFTNQDPAPVPQEPTQVVSPQ